jgi:hypothetical protein
MNVDDFLYCVCFRYVNNEITKTSAKENLFNRKSVINDIFFGEHLLTLLPGDVFFTLQYNVR